MAGRLAAGWLWAAGPLVTLPATLRSPACCLLQPRSPRSAHTLDCGPAGPLGLPATAPEAGASPHPSRRRPLLDPLLQRG